MARRFRAPVAGTIVGLVASLATVTAGTAELGLQLYSLRNQMAEDLPAALAQVADWDLDYVEGGGSLYGFTVDAFRDELEKNGLSLISVDTSFEELRDNPLAAVYKARYYGAEFATFYWIPHDGSTGFTIDDVHKTVAVLNEAGKLLKENNVTLQYHVHGYEFLPHGDGTLFDVMAIEVKNAKFQMDVYWVRQGGADPAELLKKYPGIFTSLHLKDRSHGTRDSSDGHADVETNVVLGQGDVGIADVVRLARQQGIRYFFLEDESSRVLEQIPKSLHYLESLPSN